MSVGVIASQIDVLRKLVKSATFLQVMANSSRTKGLGLSGLSYTSSEEDLRMTKKQERLDALKKYVVFRVKAIEFLDMMFLYQGLRANTAI